ncbi:hypothetical protein CSAL01_07036 [Colletotrichum salicis]|uniref:Uncharacterized protein n=1 Tax=Colletotrichum salicis TaxID=1209931 RepID=A0A135UND4_9PEZI|nr:hypothetical protein CSAL01_07036 [Colletotrichum salicis]
MIEFVREIQVEYLETPAPFSSVLTTKEDPNGFPLHATRRTAPRLWMANVRVTQTLRKGCRVRGGEGYFDFHSCADAENVEKRRSQKGLEEAERHGTMPAPGEALTFQCGSTADTLPEIHLPSDRAVGSQTTVRLQVTLHTSPVTFMSDFDWPKCELASWCAMWLPPHSNASNGQPCLLLAFPPACRLPCAGETARHGAWIVYMNAGKANIVFEVIMMR